MASLTGSLEGFLKGFLIRLKGSLRVPSRVPLRGSSRVFSKSQVSGKNIVWGLALESSFDINGKMDLEKLV